ncbi:MAG: SbcC/MukB-like Walker B domain-containing protein [Chthoniobacter sp.]|uniref:SbcC/MukB-like Walker B domain-containing protein n=1 Tax=Chthoniobacter sp. TaxID=2510640 RepID=UPI0032A3F009
MASRCIRLTRLHAIQWFGYCDTFDVHGNVLIAGRTGAGKSVLMDLLQLVLIGDQRSKYNAASDGRGHTSGRDKKSYCLCDTQEDVNGIPQFARDGGATFIALEFTWPDGATTETWGMRIDYADAATQSPDEEFFRIPTRLERSDFVTPDGFALESDGFRLLLKKHDGETFRNVTDYRKRLAEHLNFHRETIDFLMPSAMSFAFLPKFDAFCRSYILQAEDIKIQPVQDSYRSYLRIREELDKLGDKADRLERIVGARREWEEARRDADALGFLEADFRREATRAEAAELREKLAEIDKRQARQREEFDEVSRAFEAKKQDLESLKNLFRDEGGAVLLELKAQIAKAVDRIKELKQIGETVEEEKARRLRATASFQKQAAAFLAERNAGKTGELEHALAALAGARADGLKSALRGVAAAVRGVAERLRASVKAESELSQKTVGELKSLQDQLRNLEFNRVVPSPLLDELNKRLPRRGRENPARQLRELCEVVDEDWRPAIELAFARKFAIVVSRDDYAEALRIYKDFAQDSERESLVDPERALARHPAGREDSLARKIECADSIARAVVNELFGGVACVDSLEDLRRHPDAIMRDGFRLRGLFAERPRRYDQRPCIGAKGLDRLKAHLTAQADECSARLRDLEPLLTRETQLERSISEHRLDSEDIDADLAAARQLGELEAERDRLIARNTAATTPELEGRMTAISGLEKEVGDLDKKRLDLHGKLQSNERSDLSTKCETAQRAQERAEKDYDSIVGELGERLVVARCDELRAELKGRLLVDAVCASHAAQQQRDLESKLPGIADRVQLLRQGLVDQHPELRAEPDFDPKTAWNPSYAKLLDRIRVEDMPARQQQARDEELRWQDLFRTTVASRLASAIRDVRKTITDLNLQLKKPIGDSQYHIRVDDNPAREFQEYRRVLDACSITQDGESIFASLETDTRDAVERVFRALVEEPEGKLAQAFLDYRSYFRYDMEVSDPRRPELGAKSLNRHADKFSGGEKQTPFYISILACYLRAYKRHLPQRYTEPSLGIVPIDEAFSKMSGERITDAIRALRDVDLQGILSMSSGNWPYAIGECDQVLAVHQRESFVEGRKHIRNIGALLNRQQAIERSKEWA